MEIEMPDFSDRMWKDFLPENRMSLKVENEFLKVQFPFAGCKSSDFDIESSGMFLTVKVSRRKRVPEEEGDKHYSCCERSWEEYQESIKLPVPVVPAEAKATYRNGVLEITLPRSGNGKIYTRQIQVQ